MERTPQPNPRPSPFPSASPSSAPTHVACFDICPAALANVTAGVVSVVARVRREVDAVLGALMPRFGLPGATAPGGAAAPPEARRRAAAAGGAAPVLDAYAAAVRAEVHATAHPLKVASRKFLDLYDDKLDQLLASAATTKSAAAAAAASTGNGGVGAARGRTALSSGGGGSGGLSAAQSEVVGHVEVGVGAWASSCASVAALVAAVFLEARRQKHANAAAL